MGEALVQQWMPNSQYDDDDELAQDSINIDYFTPANSQRKQTRITKPSTYAMLIIR